MLEFFRANGPPVLLLLTSDHYESVPEVCAWTESENTNKVFRDDGYCVGVYILPAGSTTQALVLVLLSN